MQLDIKRISDSGESTIGALFINGDFHCWTLEDTYRREKIAGITRIPEGLYDIGIRHEGTLKNKYDSKHTDINHNGMIHILNVPNFKYIYIHIGNGAGDSEGCVLVGNTVNNNNVANGFIGNSTYAYKKLYPLVRAAFDAKESVKIHIADEIKK